MHTSTPLSRHRLQGSFLQTHLVESFWIGAVDEENDGVCARVVFLPQIPYLIVEGAGERLVRMHAEHDKSIHAMPRSCQTCSWPPKSHAVKVMLPSENVLACALVVGTNARNSLLHSLCRRVDLPALSRPARCNHPHALR